MKKILPIILSVFLLTPLASEELQKPNRYFELGVDVSGSLGNNYFQPQDILKKELIIDLSKMASEMPTEGFGLSDLIDIQAKINLNINEKARFGLFVGIEGSGIGNVSKELFDLLGNGNNLQDSVNIDSSLNQDIFFKIGGTFSSKIGKVQFKVTPTLFSPLVHAELSDTQVSIEYPDAGGINVSAETTVNINSFTNLQDLGKLSSSAIMNQISKGFGFDISGSAEFPLFETLQIGAFTRIPIIPGRMYYKGKMKAYANASVSNLEAIASGGKAYDVSYGIGNMEYSEEEYSVNRPMRFGVEAAWRPFGSWFTLYPMAGIGIKYPFTDKVMCYPEYTVALRLKVANFLYLELSTNYLQQVFIHEGMLIINARIIQINTGVSLQSTDFVKSFGTRGMGAKVSVMIGF